MTQVPCHLRAMPGEPMFTLLARDPAAPYALVTWNQTREALGLETINLPQLAGEMVYWRSANEGAWRNYPVDGFQGSLREELAKILEAFVNDHPRDLDAALDAIFWTLAG